jgi:hypothetical protein
METPLLHGEQQLPYHFISFCRAVPSALLQLWSSSRCLQYQQETSTHDTKWRPTYPCHGSCRSALCRLLVFCPLPAATLHKPNPCNSTMFCIFSPHLCIVGSSCQAVSALHPPIPPSAVCMPSHQPYCSSYHPSAVAAAAITPSALTPAMTAAAARAAASLSLACSLSLCAPPKPGG